MSLLDGFLAAFRALRTNLMRSFLTTLGIVIGIFSVIVMIALGASANHAIERQVASFGTQMLMVYAGSSQSGGRAAGAGTSLPLTEDDLRAIEEKVPGVTAISGQLYQVMPAVNGNANWSAPVIGCHDGLFAALNYRIGEGRALNADDVRSGARVAILAPTVVAKLFPDGDSPLGAIIRIKGVAFTVIGVTEARGSALGSDQDDRIFVPITASRGRIFPAREGSRQHVGMLYVKLATGVNLAEAKEQIEAVLRQVRRIPDDEPLSFVVQDLRENVRTFTSVVSTLGLLLAGTAAISLLVGGVGIMNIMLVSVTERTREIGLRMAVGGRRRDILRQFLIEAVVLCLIGGLIGLGLAKALIAFAGSMAPMALFIPWSAVALALAVATVTGVGFGYLPARRAARLNPIEALRSE